MQTKPYYDWSDLNSLVPRKDQTSSRDGLAENHAKPTPTLLLRANRYLGFALYVISEAGST